MSQNWTPVGGIWMAGAYAVLASSHFEGIYFWLSLLIAPVLFVVGVWLWDWSPLPNDNHFRQHGVWQPFGSGSGYREDQ